MATELHDPDVIAEMNKNWEVFKKIEKSMEKEHRGKTLLMRDGEVVDIFNHIGDAYKIGCEKFGLGRFSLQVVGQRSVDLGSHTMSLSETGSS